MNDVYIQFLGYVRPPLSLPYRIYLRYCKNSHRADDRYGSYRIKSLDIRVTVSRITLLQKLPILYGQERYFTKHEASNFTKINLDEYSLSI